MNAQDWTYTGEGGKHALFLYRPKQRPEKIYQGRLLRLTKKDLALSVVVYAEYEENSCRPSTSAPLPLPLHSSSSSTPEDSDSLTYIQDIIVPRLSPFLDLPEKVSLEWQLVKELRDQALAQGRIPSGRQQDWALIVPQRQEKPESPQVPAPHASALLLFDYRFSRCRSIAVASASASSREGVPQPQLVQVQAQRNYSFLSVEIKPKAGYLAISPLVDPTRRVKYRFSRFAIMQRLCLDGHVTKPWKEGGSSLSESSRYDPLDLFSGDSHRIRQAVQNLVTCPQNNLKVWLGDEALFGVSPARPSPKWERLGNDWWSADDRCGPSATNVESFVVDMAASVLDGDNILSNLLPLQKLDIVDAEGAILLYDRLVQLVGGSRDDAERLLDDAIPDTPLKDTKTTSVLHPLLLDSPLSSPNGSYATMNRLCEEIERFERRLECASPSLPSEEEMESARLGASRLLEELSAEECRFLLQNYLLSLAMCDVSFFITIYPASTAVELLEEHTIRARSFTVVSKQEQDKPGMIAFSGDTSAGIERGVYLYEIKVIDCDRKPAKKLRLRRSKEEPLCLATMELLKESANAAR
jgi:hypothetical protein